MAMHLAALPPTDEHIACVSVPLRAVAPSEVLAPLALVLVAVGAVLAALAVTLAFLPRAHVHVAAGEVARA